MKIDKKDLIWSLILVSLPIIISLMFFWFHYSFESGIFYFFVLIFIIAFPITYILKKNQHIMGLSIFLIFYYIVASILIYMIIDLSGGIFS